MAPAGLEPVSLFSRVEHANQNLTIPMTFNPTMYCVRTNTFASVNTKKPIERVLLEAKVALSQVRRNAVIDRHVVASVDEEVLNLRVSPRWAGIGEALEC